MLTFTKFSKLNVFALKESDDSSKEIVNKVFCSCDNTIPAEQLPKDKIKIKSSSLLDVFRNIFLMSIKDKDASVNSKKICSENEFLIKCENPKHGINIVLASVGVHENKCFENNSTFDSMHSTGKSLCHEAMRSTQIAVGK